MTDALPVRPRLKDRAAVVMITPVDLLVRAPGVFARLSGDGVSIFTAIRPLLDGAHTLAEIAAACDVEVADVVDLVAALAHDCVIEDGAPEGVVTGAEIEAARRDHPDLWALLSSWSGQPITALRRITGAHVRVVGSGQLAAATATALTDSGPQVTRAEPDDDDDDDDDEAAAVEARTWQRLCQDTSHLIVTSDAPRPTFLAAANAAALHYGVPLTTAWSDLDQLIIGPTILPYESACWRCFDLRAKGVHPHMDRLIAYEQHLQDRDAHAPRPAGTRAQWLAAGALLADAVLTELSGVVVPSLVGQIAVYRPEQMEVRRHRVLRMPRCPACGAAGVPDVDRFDLRQVSVS